MKASQLFEIVPNLSEGREAATIDAAAAAVRRSGARLIDRSSDAVHHRSVLTIAGSAEQVLDAAVALAGVALERIDLRAHRGVHPRIGALDVLPFVPLAGADAPRRRRSRIAREPRSGNATAFLPFITGRPRGRASAPLLPDITTQRRMAAGRGRRPAPPQRRRDRDRRPRRLDRLQR